jgi:hypothetical protein
VITVEEFVISTVDIAEYVHKRLIESGYAPTADEVFDLAEIFFEYLVENSIIEELEEDED